MRTSEYPQAQKFGNKAEKEITFIEERWSETYY
jgi:hypothetical protein